MSVPMTRDELADWFRLRVADEAPISELVTEHFGQTEVEMDELYDRICGHTA